MVILGWTFLILLALAIAGVPVVYVIVRRSRAKNKDRTLGEGEMQPGSHAASVNVPARPVQQVRDQSGGTAATPPQRDSSTAAQSKSGVFISYRRDDKRDFARGLYERLARHLGEQQIFMDVDSIDLGVDFTEVVNQRLAQCSVMLVVIGTNWLDCVDSGGRRRLDNPDDLVRLEVETALARPGVRVIPILVDGARAPESTGLPESLRPLARRNALIMTHENFGADFGRLFTVVQKIVLP
jgi:TIR domain